jgi:hypothetical protein
MSRQAIGDNSDKNAVQLGWQNTLVFSREMSDAAHAELALLTALDRRVMQSCSHAIESKALMHVHTG